MCPRSPTPLWTVVIQHSINFIWSSHWFNFYALYLPMNTDFCLRCQHCFCLLGLLLTEFIAIRRRITLILVNCHYLWHPFCGPTFLRVVLTLRLQARAKTGQNSRPFFSSSTLGHLLWNWKWNDVIREFCPLLYFVKCIFNRFGNLYGINPTHLSVGRWRRKNVKAISYWSTITPGRPRRRL